MACLKIQLDVCLRRTPYWIAYVKGKTCKTIKTFDFSKERFEILFLPPTTIESSKLVNSFSLGVLRRDKLSFKLMTVSIPQSLMFPKCSSYFVENNGKLVLSVCGIKYIKVYIAEKDDECQNWFWFLLCSELASIGSDEAKRSQHPPPGGLLPHHVPPPSAQQHYGYQQPPPYAMPGAAPPQMWNPQAAPPSQPMTADEIRTLWIGDLQFWMDESFLYSCFAHTGEIHTRVLLQGFQLIMIQITPLSCAEEAIRMLNGTQLGGTTVRLSWGRSPSSKQAADPSQYYYGGYGQGQEHYGYSMPQDPNAYYGGYPGGYQQPPQVGQQPPQQPPQQQQVGFSY
ncbi:hypothetical protein HID58_083625 [Brassica napus]|uniref:RRM domain-containing protein n=1 Tax=Brassica napus TaxID=3708 RepID=A0ABQ7YFB9_BRANA|nr:hypothetical protein HID58_083625 [Brassica napus]